MPEMSPHFGMKLSATIEKRHFFKIKNSEVWILNKKIFTFAGYFCGNSSVGRALASQAEGREFESRFPLLVKAVRNFPGGFFMSYHRAAF